SQQQLLLHSVKNSSETIQTKFFIPELSSPKCFAAKANFNLQLLCSHSSVSSNGSNESMVTTLTESNSAFAVADQLINPKERVESLVVKTVEPQSAGMKRSRTTPSTNGSRFKRRKFGKK